MHTCLTGRAVYNHMRVVHGGIYDNEHAPVANVNMAEQVEALRQAQRLRDQRAQEQADLLQAAQGNRENQRVEGVEAAAAHPQADVAREEGGWCVIM
jgi:hypothetical protein